MKYRALLILLVMFAFRVTATAQPAPPPPPAPDYFPDKWKEYIYENDGVKIKFPVEPVITLETGEAANGIKFTTRKYVRSSFVGLQLWVIEYPSNLVSGKEALAKTWASAIEGIKAKSPKIIKETDISVDGHGGTFIHLETNDGAVTRLKFFIIANRAYYLFAAVRKGEKHGFNHENDFEKVAMGFLDSVRFISPSDTKSK